jgi:hypothetical protein
MKRKRVIRRPPPVAPARKRPNFLARLKRLYRDGPLSVSGADLLAAERERF